MTPIEINVKYKTLDGKTTRFTYQTKDIQEIFRLKINICLCLVMELWSSQIEVAVSPSQVAQINDKIDTSSCSFDIHMLFFNHLQQFLIYDFGYGLSEMNLLSKCIWH